MNLCCGDYSPKPSWSLLIAIDGMLPLETPRKTNEDVLQQFNK